MKRNRHTGDGAEVFPSPLDVNFRVAHWKMEFVSAQSAEDLRALIPQLKDEPELILAQLRQPFVNRLQELQREASMVSTQNGHRKEDSPAHTSNLDGMQKTLQSIREAAEKVKAGEPGATGLIPLGNLRDGGDVLSQHRVTIRDQLKGNRAGIFAQSGKGKTNLVKVVLFWTAFNSTYGKLVFDYKGEYVPWTQNERGEDVPGLCEHPLASERVVLYTTKARHLEDDTLNGKIKVRALKVHLRSILPRDFALFWPNLTKPQQEFLYTFDEDSNVYDTILGEEKEWPKKLGAWFGDAAAQTGEDDDAAKPDHSAKRVVRNIRKKLQAAQKRSYIIDSSVRIDKGADGQLVLHTPYNKGFVKALKDQIPGDYRSWDNQAKTWTIDESCEPTLMRLIENHYGSDTDLDSLGYILQDLADGKLVVVDLSGIVSEADRDLIATLINRRLFEYNLERIDLDEGKDGRIPLVVFFEEAQNLLGSDKVRDNKNSIFVRTFKEGRALSIGTTTITQQPGALAKELTSQMAYYIIQHLRSREDVRELVAMDPALAGAEVDIARRVPGNALYVDNDRGFPLPVKIDRFDKEFVEAVRAAYEQLQG